MENEIVVKVKSKLVKKYKKGYPLLTAESIENDKELTVEGSVFTLVDDRNQFMARGYYGKQNKGIGWTLTHVQDELINLEFFIKKIKHALNARKHLFGSPDTTAFRVFNGEGDGIGGLTIDYFDGYYLMNWYSEGIYSFRKSIIEALTTSTAVKGLYQKKRFDSAGKYIEEDDFVTGEQATFPLLIKENGVNYAVYLNEGAMVGIFLDQREVRRRIMENYALGKTVLNTFSYTGAFSVAAAMGGATKTTSVDLANRSLEKTIEQFSVNRLDFEAHDIRVMDVFRYFKYAKKNELTFEMVILDPPSFARSKKNTFRAEKDYTNLLKETIDITAEKGIIVASTNCSKFDMKRFKQFIEVAFRESDYNYQILEEHSLPQDFKTNPAFPEGDYLKVIFIKKL
ncbi:class I SAM-dependent rRNA methyltransferase [Bacillus fonticola]|uniref:class I SAM-dependent rRNA methyltransferase n=1 Tax=Bacillus fonticola TaxID=2728853 RepID=UPI0014744374|nr:class I SAM-dependent rRNA methyltransferase [Bacillus fonticola]